MRRWPLQGAETGKVSGLSSSRLPLSGDELRVGLLQVGVRLLRRRWRAVLLRLGLGLLLGLLKDSLPPELFFDLGHGRRVDVEVDAKVGQVWAGRGRVDGRGATRGRLGRAVLRSLRLHWGRRLRLRLRLRRRLGLRRRLLLRLSLRRC